MTNFFRKTSSTKTHYKQKYIKDFPNYLKRFFTNIKTTGDGNCFYYGISILLCGNESLMMTLRALEAAHLLINESFIKKNPLSMLNSSSIKNCLTVNTYAEIGSVIMLALILQKNINLHTNEPNSSLRIASNETNENFHLYCDLIHEHYTALIPKLNKIPLPNELDKNEFDFNSFKTF